MVNREVSYSTYEEMYDKEYNRVFSYVKRTVRSNEMVVEDLTQDVFLLAYEKWDEIKEHPNIPGYLMVTARNKLRRWFEKQSRVYLDDDDTIEYAAFEQEDPGKMDAFVMAEFYASAQSVISASELQILRYYYEFGYTSTELAKKLGISEACFKIRIVRMKQKLKNSLKVLMPLFIGICVRNAGLF